MGHDVVWCSATDAIIGIFLEAYDGSNICIRRPLKPPSRPVDIPTVIRTRVKRGRIIIHETMMVLNDDCETVFLMNDKNPHNWMTIKTPRIEKCSGFLTILSDIKGTEADNKEPTILQILYVKYKRQENWPGNMRLIVNNGMQFEIKT